jgi:four helix bundle protein
MTIRSYVDLVAWQKAMDLAVSVYRVTQALPPEERFGLTAQTRRGAVSVASNIAEGKGRRTDGEFMNHLSMAHGSVCEIETQLLLAERLGFIEPQAVKPLLVDAAEVGRLIKGLMKSLRADS